MKITSNSTKKIVLVTSLILLLAFSSFALWWFVFRDTPKPKDDYKPGESKKDPAKKAPTETKPPTQTKSPSKTKSPTKTKSPRARRSDSYDISSYSGPTLAPFRQTYPIAQHPALDSLKQSKFFNEIANMNYYDPLGNGDCFYNAVVFLIFDNIKNVNDPFFLRLFKRNLELNFENAAFTRDDFVNVQKRALEIICRNKKFVNLNAVDLGDIVMFLRYQIYLNRLNHKETLVHFSTSSATYKKELEDILKPRVHAFVDFSYDVAEILDCNVFVYCTNQDVSDEFSRHNFNKKRTLRLIHHADHFYAVVP